jgi:hypothetical protein
MSNETITTIDASAPIEARRAEVARLLTNANTCAQTATDLRAALIELPSAIARAYASGDVMLAAERERSLAEGTARLPHLHAAEEMARNAAASLDKSVALVEMPDANGAVASASATFARTLRQLHADAVALHRERGKASSVFSRCGFAERGPSHPSNPIQFIALEGFAFRLYNELQGTSL